MGYRRVGRRVAGAWGGGGDRRAGQGVCMNGHSHRLPRTSPRPLLVVRTVCRVALGCPAPPLPRRVGPIARGSSWGVPTSASRIGL